MLKRDKFRRTSRTHSARRAACHEPFSHQASLVPQRYSASSTNTPLWCWHSADLRPFRVQPGLLVSSDAAVPLCFVDGGICPGHQANSAPQPPMSFRCRFAKPRFPRTLGYSDAGTPRISGSVARTSSGFLRPAGSRIRSKGDHFFDLVLPRCPRSSFLLVRVLRRHLNAPLIPLLTPINERAADGALCSGEGRRTTKERRSDASETERLLNVKPEVILGSLTAGYVISDDCQTSRLHNAGTTPNLGAPLDTNQHNYETQQLTRRDRPDFVTILNSLYCVSMVTVTELAKTMSNSGKRSEMVETNNLDWKANAKHVIAEICIIHKDLTFWTTQKLIDCSLMLYLFQTGWSTCWTRWIERKNSFWNPFAYTRE